MRKLYLLALLIAAGVSSASAQGARDSVDWAVTFVPTEVVAGRPFVARIEARIRPGWKMYAMDSPGGLPLRIEFEDSEWAVLKGAVRSSAPDEGYDPFLQARVRTYTEEASFEVPLQAASVDPGTYRLEGRAVFMLCDDRMCLPPTPTPLSASVRLISASERSTGEPSAVP